MIRQAKRQILFPRDRFCVIAEQDTYLPLLPGNDLHGIFLSHTDIGFVFERLQMSHQKNTCRYAYIPEIIGSKNSFTVFEAVEEIEKNITGAANF